MSRETGFAGQGTAEDDVVSMPGTVRVRMNSCPNPNRPCRRSKRKRSRSHCQRGRTPIIKRRPKSGIRTPNPEIDRWQTGDGTQTSLPNRTLLWPLHRGLLPRPPARISRFRFSLRTSGVPSDPRSSGLGILSSLTHLKCRGTRYSRLLVRAACRSSRATTPDWKVRRTRGLERAPRPGSQSLGDEPLCRSQPRESVDLAFGLFGRR